MLLETKANAFFSCITETDTEICELTSLKMTLKGEQKNNKHKKRKIRLRMLL